MMIPNHKPHTVFFLLVFLLVSWSACNDSEKKTTDKGDKPTDEYAEIKKKIRKAFSYNLKTAGQPARVGDQVTLSLSLALDTLPLDSVQVYVDNSVYQTYSELPNTVKMNTGNQSPGQKVVVAALNTPYGRIIKRRSVTLFSDVKPAKMTYEVVKTYPHDIGAFTQGFLFHNGYLYEATGLKGESTVRKVELKTGEVMQTYSCPSDIFGEGITIHNDKIIQLSWRARKGYVYDLNSFRRLQEFTYSSEGWGLTTVGDKLVMSDGTNVLRYLETETYNQIGRVEVFDQNGPVNKLNELEYINGAIYANIYMKDNIVKIAPRSGKVLARIDMKGLLSPEDYHKEIDVLNGIAYDEGKGRIFVTGKRWPKVYQVQFKPMPQ